MLGIPFRGTKIEANTWISVPNHSAGEKTTWNFVPWNKIRSKLSGIPFHSISRTKTCCQFCLLEQDFFENYFFHVI
jgi:hypothetical protein